MPNPKRKETKKRKTVSPQQRADDKMFRFFSLGEIVRGSEKEKARNSNQKAISRGFKPSTTAKAPRGALNRMKKKRQGKSL